MKKLILLLVLVFGGYQFYQHNFNAPYLGEWKLDKEKMMANADPEKAARISTDVVDDVFNNTKITIDSKQFHYKFPNFSGSFSYTAQKMENGCFQFKIETVGDAVGCITDDEMKMTGANTERDDYLVRTKSI